MNTTAKVAVGFAAFYVVTQVATWHNIRKANQYNDKTMDAIRRTQALLSEFFVIEVPE